MGVTQPRGFLPNRLGFAISPDGASIAYSAKHNDSQNIYIRNINELTTTVISDSEDGTSPFFSPDNKFVAYFAYDDEQLVLMKKPLDNEKTQILCTVLEAGQATWLSSGIIVFSDRTDEESETRRLFKVSDQGGTAEIIEEINSKDTQLTYAYPSALPGQNAILFTIFSEEKISVALLDLDTNQFDIIIPEGRGALYSASGHIVFARPSGLWAVPFDLESRTFNGKEVQLHPENNLQVNWHEILYALTPEGAFMFLAVPESRAEQRILAWVNRDGREETLPVPKAPYYAPALSPNGKYIVTGLADPKNEDLFIHEIASPQSLMRLTFDDGIDRGGVWMPDSLDIIFVSNRDDNGDLYRRPADGTGNLEKILERPFVQAPGTVDSQGNELVFIESNSGWDVGKLSLDNTDSITILIASEGSNNSNPDLSLNDTFIVYQSDETQSNEIYVRPYPNVEGGKWQVSSDGGVEPLWSHAGDEIFYRDENKMMAIKVSIDGDLFRFEPPIVLFESDFFTDKFGAREYDLEYPDGKRFLMIKELEPDDHTRLVYITNWTEELKRLVPPDTP